MGLLISLVALFFVVFWPLCCFFVFLREYSQRSPGSKMKWSITWQKLVVAFVGELCLIGIMYGSFWIGTTGTRALASTFQSDNNLKVISTALIQYSQDWDGTLPPASRWQDVISRPPYMNADQAATVFTCPPDSVPCGYAINASVAGAKVGDIADPEDTVLVFETRHPARNASGSNTDMAPERHAGVHSPLGFCDGNAQQRDGYRLQDVLWSPHQTQTKDTSDKGG